MPTSIPYDHPSLTLGAVVDTQVLDSLDQVATLNQAIDAAQDKMNSLIMMKRSLAMTLNELLDMNVDVSDLKSEMKALDPQISQAATGYLNTRLKNETSIQKVREQLAELKQSHIESPVDFVKSTITQQPLAYESMKLDAQYFSFGGNLEDDTLSNIETYVKEANSDLGKGAGDLAKQATSQIQQQHRNHSISGTLIITACCMHRNVTLIEPLVLDLQKAVSIWNATVGKGDPIDTNDLATGPANSKPSTSESPSPGLSIISGAAYGSSFVGMVHILNTDSDGPAEEKIASLQEKLQLGGWLENLSGGFGVNESTLSEVKKTLSTQQVSSHVSLITMGAIPSISSSKIDMGVNRIMQPDPEAINAVLQATNKDADTSTIATGADDARQGNQLLSIQNAKIQTVMKGLEKIDHGSNQVMDINSLMNAFDNYIKSITDGATIVGSPVHFYIKKLVKSDLIKMWQKRHLAEKSLATAPPAADSDSPANS